jgi:hypothetical protein
MRMSSNRSQGEIERCSGRLPFSRETKVRDPRGSFRKLLEGE